MSDDTPNTVDGYAEGEEPLVFYHKRGEFRQYYSDEKLKDLAQGKNLPKRGLFRVLVATKANRAIFTGMMMCIGLVFALSFLGGKSNEAIINGMFCDLSAFSFQDQVFASLEIRPSYKTKRAHRGPYKQQSFTVAYKVIDSDGAVSESSSQEFLYDSPEGEGQFVRATFPDYDAAKVLCDVTLGDRTETLSVTIVKK